MVGARGQEIGTLQAIGVQRRWTISILVAEAALLGAIGGALGAAGALGVVAAVSHGVPFSVPGAGVYFVVPALTTADVTVAVALAALVIMLTTLRPAIYIARRPPIALIA